MNEFLTRKIQNSKYGSRSEMIKTAQDLEQFQVDSELRYAQVFALRHYLPWLIKKSEVVMAPEVQAALAQELYAENFQGTTELIKLWQQRLEKNFSRSSTNKTAYPQGNGIGLLETPRNLHKWMETLQKIYAFCQQGADLSAATHTLTQEWDKMERQDFQHWMGFYQEQAHQKYKTAQYIPIQNLKANLPMAPDMSSYVENDNIDPGLSAAQKQEEIDKKIRSIVSRLSAAERLATDPEVQKLLQKKLDIGISKWLEELHRVKRMVQLAPIRHVASPILEDLICKHARRLQRSGFPKAAAEMLSLAQETTIPQPVVPSDPMAPAAPELPAAPLEEEKSALDEMVEGMNLGEDLDDSNDVIEMDEVDPQTTLHIIAQEVPVALPPKPAPVLEPETPPDLQVAEPGTDQVVMEPEPTAAPVENANDSVAFPQDEKSKTDDFFDAALNSITVHDVINRLESIANVFRTREIYRQLAIIDLMMDRLGISSYFPTLAEATTKNLDATQYSLTRVEDILSKLRGSIETPASEEIDLTGDSGAAPLSEALPSAINPDAVKQNLQQQELADKSRKERRKEEQLAAEEMAVAPALTEAPVTQVVEDLSQPAALTQPAKS